jgi:hypothetical protein
MIDVFLFHVIHANILRETGTSKRLHPGFDTLEVYWVIYHQNSTLSPISDNISRRRSPQCSGLVPGALGEILVSSLHQLLALLVGVPTTAGENEHLSSE